MVFPTLSPASRNELYPSLNLQDIHALHANNPGLQPEINHHYYQRYITAIESHISLIRSFNTVVNSTSSFLSGPVVLRYIYPELTKSKAESLDIYVKRPHTDLMLNHICHRQGYELISQPIYTDLSIPQYNSSCEAPDVDKTVNGVELTYLLKKKDLHIRIIVAASNISALFPIPFFPLTVEMNVLTPSGFLSLYPSSALNYEGFISDNAYANPSTDINRNRVIQFRSRLVVDFFLEAGFRLAEHRGNLTSEPLRRSSNDPYVLRIEFDNRQSFEFPDSLYPPVYWCLGGTIDNDCDLTASYHKFSVYTSI